MGLKCYKKANEAPLAEQQMIFLYKNTEINQLQLQKMEGNKTSVFLRPK